MCRIISRKTGTVIFTASYARCAEELVLFPGHAKYDIIPFW